MLSNFYILSASHREISLDAISRYAIKYNSEAGLESKLHNIKERVSLDELMYLSTCNRVEYVFVTKEDVNDDFRLRLTGQSDCSALKLYAGEEAVYYLFQVASSIHSMVVGEREIITQIRTAYEQQVKWNLTGDLIRIVVQQMVKAAKGVYARTRIGEKPVSVVSLAVRQILNQGITPDTPIIMVGAGNTNRLMLRHLTKKGFEHVSIYNRSVEKARALASQVKGNVGTLENLSSHTEEFGCLVACTGASQTTVDYETAMMISKGDVSSKVWVDLGLPWDLDEKLHHLKDENIINLSKLQNIAQDNLQIRQQEVQKANQILKDALADFKELLHHRRIERAFIHIPAEIKYIKEKAVTEVFKKELAAMDGETQSVVQKMMDYMERKCISVPMKVAKGVEL